MPKASEAKLHKHTLNLFDGDYERIGALHPDVDTALIIRTILREYCEKHEAVAQAPTVKITIPAGA